MTFGDYSLTYRSSHILLVGHLGDHAECWGVKRAEATCVFGKGRVAGKNDRPFWGQ